MIFLIVSFFSKIQDLTPNTLATDKASGGASVIATLIFGRKRKSRNVMYFFWLFAEDFNAGKL